MRKVITIITITGNTGLTWHSKETDNDWPGMTRRQLRFIRQNKATGNKEILNGGDHRAKRGSPGKIRQQASMQKAMIITTITGNTRLTWHSKATDSNKIRLA